MSYIVDNAIIMAAGLSSRFTPLSYEMPKGLIKVKGEVLIERQIRQLKEANINEIIVITGYQSEKFTYLVDLYGVKLIYNNQFQMRNNHYSLYLAKDYLKNTYICSADNYFIHNPFKKKIKDSYYASVYVDGHTDEWCVQYDNDGLITNVTVGGTDSWIMLGHAFFSNNFSNQFKTILNQEIHYQETKNKLWEQLYIEHIKELNLFIQKYNSNDIFEFDSLDELRVFDSTYLEHSGSIILNHICSVLHCKESEINHFLPLKENNEVVGCSFLFNKDIYYYFYSLKRLEKKDETVII